MGCKIYIKEGVRRVEELLHDTYMTPRDHQKLDETELLNDEGHKLYQMLIEMLNWTIIIDRLDIAFAVSSLSHFVVRGKNI